MRCCRMHKVIHTLILWSWLRTLHVQTALYMYINVCTYMQLHWKLLHPLCLWSNYRPASEREWKYQNFKIRKEWEWWTMTQPVPQEHLLLFELSTAQLCFICWKFTCSTVNTHSNIHSFNRQEEYVAPIGWQQKCPKHSHPDIACKTLAL